MAGSGVGPGGPGGLGGLGGLGGGPAGGFADGQGLAGDGRPQGAPPAGVAPDGGATSVVPDGGTAGGAGFGGAGFPGGAQVDTALADFLAANHGDATWIVAVSGSEQAGSIELATGLPVMAMGGFNGGDPAPTLEQLQAYVASGQLRYVIVGGGGGPNGGNSAITDWVIANGTVVSEVGNGSLYDLSPAG